MAKVLVMTDKMKERFQQLAPFSDNATVKFVPETYRKVFEDDEEMIRLYAPEVEITALTLSEVTKVKNMLNGNDITGKKIADIIKNKIVNITNLFTADEEPLEWSNKVLYSLKDAVISDIFDKICKISGLMLQAQLQIEEINKLKDMLEEAKKQIEEQENSDKE